MKMIQICLGDVKNVVNDDGFENDHGTSVHMQQMLEQESASHPTSAFVLKAECYKLRKEKSSFENKH